MLYDGALRFMQAGREAILSGDLYAQNTNLQKAQRIVAELTSCLDLQQGGEIAQNLFALYDFVYNRLIAANVEDNLAALDQAMKVMIDLRESWDQLASQPRTTPQLEVEIGGHDRAA
jgi:flagellar protein FliS